jgi:hypothetical protein
VGKSSLINAAIVPSMTASKWVVLPMRPHDSPLSEITAALLRPSAIWRKPPAAPSALRNLIEQAAERAQRDGKRMLLVLDQFEEALILCSDETKEALSLLLCDLAERPVTGVKILLSLRAEYLNDLPALGLPFPAFGPGQNAFEVRPFTRAAAEAFIENSGLELASGLRDKVLDEASEIEDMPDRVRPIILNMFGLVVRSFTGGLPKGVSAGRLLSGYVERCLKDRAIESFSVNVFRPLVTDAGTKRALTAAQIAEKAGIPPSVTRGCLIHFANDGLVRRLHGTPEKWEVAHDFVVRLLQPLLRSWQKSIWDRSRPYLVPIPLLVWLLAMVGLTVFYPALHDEYILRELRTVGLVPGAPTEDGITFITNGTSIEDVAHFWEVGSLLQGLRSPVLGLNLSETNAHTILQGMPALPRLISLDLNNSSVTSLEGMPTLPALTDLNLHATGVTSLEGMPALPALIKLDLSETDSFTSLQGMPALPALMGLDLSGTQVTSLQGMPALPALIFLSLADTQVASLEGMPALPALTGLDLSGTQLTSLQGMPALPALTTLDLNNSSVTSLEGMPVLPLLATIDLRGTPITDLSSLSQLPALAKIRIAKGQINRSKIPSTIKAKLEVSD